MQRLKDSPLGEEVEAMADQYVTDEQLLSENEEGKADKTEAKSTFLHQYNFSFNQADTRALFKSGQDETNHLRSPNWKNSPQNFINLSQLLHQKTDSHQSVT